MSDMNFLCEIKSRIIDCLVKERNIIRTKNLFACKANSYKFASCKIASALPTKPAIIGHIILK